MSVAKSTIAFLTTASIATCVSVSNIHSFDNNKSVACQLKETFVGFKRIWRSMYTLASVSMDYKVSLFSLDQESDEYRAAKNQAHARSAQKLLSLCKENGGVYAKAGQYFGSMHGILPVDYTRSLSELQHQVHVTPWQELEMSLKHHSTGRKIIELTEIQKIPLASGTMAQVHLAIRQDGSQVALKIRHPFVESYLETDFAFMKFAAHLLEKIFPEFVYGLQLVDYEARIRKELDFDVEAQNMTIVRKLYGDHGPFYVPSVHHDLSCESILAMEYIDGARLFDTQDMTRIGTTVDNVVRLLYEYISQQIFVHGHIHGDPHPGNFLIRKNKVSGNFQLVILDHALYHTISDEFRIEICGLWISLIQNKQTDIKKFFAKHGIEDFEVIVSKVLLNESAEQRAQSNEVAKIESPQKSKSELSQKRRVSRLQLLQQSPLLPNDLVNIIRAEALLHYSIPKVHRNSRQRLQIYTKNAFKGYWKSSDSRPPTEE